VRPNGSDNGNHCETAGSPCATLGRALSQAGAGDTVQLEPGTYKEAHNPSGTSNVVPARKSGITIQSDPVTGTAANTIIDATGRHHGIVVNANDTTIKRISIRNADLQGILVSPPGSAAPPAVVRNVTISDNIVTNDDACWHHPTSHDCPPPDPNDDYGEAIQLLSVAHSTVTGNRVTHNVGGILLTDEVGPNHDNTISNNIVSDNTKDCGITLAGHSPAAVATSGANAGKPRPNLAGIYHNTISGNVANGNGAAGIIVAAGGPGAGAYGNLVTGNTANDNGIAGISVHSHTPFQDANGNIITNNTLSHDALSGGAGGGPGDGDAGVTKTTGILVLAATSPVTGTVIAGNHISKVTDGVWLSAMTPTATVAFNAISTTAGGTPIVVQNTNAPIVGIVNTIGGNGYWMLASDGTVHPFGDAGYYGSATRTAPSPIVGMATTHDGKGYWMVATDGGIFSFGDAHFYGSTASQ
jgi:parallel beta-helix repeat protein